MRHRKKTVLGLTLASAALIVAGCGGSDGGQSSADATTTAAPVKEKGVPPKLAAVRAQANEILDEGQLEPTLANLRGHPVVVNQWASWCEPCRAEFPFFRDSAQSHATEIAFLGIDMQDDRGDAEAFLEELPVPYPSIYDPSAKEIASLGGGIVSPTTVFIDEKGEIVNVFQGSYASRTQLEDDIERHLR